jgi:MFS family permease
MVCSKEVNPLGLSGIAMGTVNTSGFLGAAILQPLLGKVLDMNWDGVVMNGVRLYPLHAYRSAFLVCFYIALAGVAATVLVKETRCRNVEEQL